MILNVKNVLMSYDIDVTLNNEFASSASGGLAPFDTWPEVWLLNDNDYDRAKKIIDYISLGGSNKPISLGIYSNKNTGHVVFNSIRNFAVA